MRVIELLDGCVEGVEVGVEDVVPGVGLHRWILADWEIPVLGDCKSGRIFEPIHLGPGFKWLYVAMLYLFNKWDQCITSYKSSMYDLQCG